MNTPTLVRRVFSASPWSGSAALRAALASETIGGAVLLAAAVVAVTWASSPFGDAYRALRDTVVGPSALHLDLSLGTWAADGLLAIFFFVAGLELKRELVIGDLRDPARAAVPVVAAIAGVVLPAGLFLLASHVLAGADPEVARGWAIPTATDIAFALAVLAVVAPNLPGALRSFLLTLAVVDDLIAITIIATFYTSSLQVTPLILAVLPLLGFAWCVRTGRTSAWVLLPLAFLTWYLVHASGVHATVAGVLLGLVVPIARDGADGEPAGGEPPRPRPIAEVLEHRVHPISAAVAVPIFAFFASGVDLSGEGALAAVVQDPAAVAVSLGLVVGKVIGVVGGAWLVARLTAAELDPELLWRDIVGVGFLAGIGFTVSLLVSELAYGAGSPHDEHVKAAVLVASLSASVLAGLVLRGRNAAFAPLSR